MTLAAELADLFQRDLTRLVQQVHAFANREVLWECPPGITNSAGNLMLHLEGNLREYVCRLLGGLPYQRERDREFSSTGVSGSDIAARLEEVSRLVPGAIRQLTKEQMEAAYPENPLGKTLTTQQFLIHLNGHLNYHLGQIDYLRRLLTRGEAVRYAGL